VLEVVLVVRTMVVEQKTDTGWDGLSMMKHNFETLERTAEKWHTHTVSISHTHSPSLFFKPHQNLKPLHYHKPQSHHHKTS
jgi:hypothetical protein